MIRFTCRPAPPAVGYRQCARPILPLSWIMWSCWKTSLQSPLSCRAGSCRTKTEPTPNFQFGVAVRASVCSQVGFRLGRMYQLQQLLPTQTRRFDPHTQIGTAAGGTTGALQKWNFLGGEHTTVILVTSMLKSSAEFRVSNRAHASHRFRMGLQLLIPKIVHEVARAVLLA